MKPTCKTCNRELEYSGTGRIPSFCSDKCRVKYHRDHKRQPKHQVDQFRIRTDGTTQNWAFICPVCGKEMQRKRKYCSARCRQKAYRQRNEKYVYFSSYDRETWGTEKLNRLKETDYTFGELVKND